MPAVDTTTELPEPYDLSPRDAAALIGCHEDTLKRWAADGEIPAFRTPGGWWKFRRSDIDAFLTRPATPVAAPSEEASA